VTGTTDAPRALDPAEQRTTAGIAATAVAVVIWGASSVLVKAIDGIDGVGISFYRLLFATGFLGSWFLLRGGRFSPRMLWLCVPGGVTFALDLMFFFSALRETSTANATVIGALQPILLLPIGIRLFGEHVDRSVVAWSFVAVTGTVVVVLGGHGLPQWSPYGDLLATLALISWTAYFVASKSARNRLGSVEYFTGLTVVALAVITPYTFLAGADLSPDAGSDWVAIVAVTLFSGALGHVLLNWSYPHVPLQVMSLLTLLVPVVATTGAVLFLDEPMDPLQWVGMAVVVAALAEVVRRTSRPRAPAPLPAPETDAIDRR
jgi:drug/metabolite transporter (DMT)-like permease